MLRFRPHHFFCALGFEGKGYSDRFTQNLSNIVIGQLRAPQGDAAAIEVTAATDDICTPCPKRIGTRCMVQGKITALDQRHAAALEIKAGDVLTWGEAQARMADLPSGIHQKICAGCSWLTQGMCEAAHHKLKDSLKKERAG